MATLIKQNLLHKKFDESNKGMQECAICAVEYVDSDSITPLPCNPGHYFHTECIEKWMDTK